MAQGPGGDGFKVGHRASKSVYADKAATEPATANETVSEKMPLGGSTAADVAVAADTAVSEVDVTKAVVE